MIPSKDMFIGIVEGTGVIKKMEDQNGKVYLTISVPDILGGVKIGDSIACDGVCLTVVRKAADAFTVELMPETLRVTAFSDAKKGDLINLERAAKIGDRISGHFISGHVDCVGTVKEVIKEGKYTSLFITVPKKYAKYLAYKGSVAVNGVSLTIAASKANWLKVCLITHTLKVTNLSELKKGSKANIEVDLIARYLEKLATN